jgi:hypothetical protein
MAHRAGRTAVPRLFLAVLFSAAIDVNADSTNPRTLLATQDEKVIAQGYQSSATNEQPEDFASTKPAEFTAAFFEGRTLPGMTSLFQGTSRRLDEYLRIRGAEGWRVDSLTLNALHIWPNTSNDIFNYAANVTLRRERAAVPVEHRVALAAYGSSDGPNCNGAGAAYGRVYAIDGGPIPDVPITGFLNDQAAHGWAVSGLATAARDLSGGTQLVLILSRGPEAERAAIWEYRWIEGRPGFDLCQHPYTVISVDGTYMGLPGQPLEPYLAGVADQGWVSVWSGVTPIAEVTNDSVRNPYLRLGGLSMIFRRRVE